MNLKAPPTSLKLVAGLAALVLAGAGLLSLPWLGSLAFSDALFTSVSALTVTGLSTVNLGEELNLVGLIALTALIQLGGVGYMVAAVLIFRLLGRSIGLADRLALQDSLGLLNRHAIVTLAQRVFITVVAVEAVGAAFLFFWWGDLYPPDKRLLLACFQSVSAFCNAMFDITTGSPVFPSGSPTDPVTTGAYCVLAILGGLGIPVLYDLVLWRPGRRTSLHTKMTLAVTSALLLVGGVLIFAAEIKPGGTLAGLSWLEQAGRAFGQAALGRTAGWTTLPDFLSITPGTQLVLIALMFVGAAPASMGGGITTGTFAVMILALLAYAKGQEKGRVGGREIPHEMVRKAFAVVTISLGVIFTTSLLLVLTHPIGAMEAVFESVSAFTTTGLSLGLSSRLSPVGEALLMAAMIWGRLGGLTILFLFTRSQPPGRVRYPEEKVLIG